MRLAAPPAGEKRGTYDYGATGKELDRFPMTPLYPCQGKQKSYSDVLISELGFEHS